MNISPRQPLFNRRSTSNVYRIFLFTLMILGGLWVVYGVKDGEIKALGAPLPTSTRAAVSFESEGEAYFRAGELGAAIAAYQKAIEANPEDPNPWAEIARIQTYSSALKTTDEEKRTVLQAALKSINQAKVLAPDSSEVAAIRAFVLDWNADPTIFPDTAADSLLEAEREATRAQQLDNQSVLALAYKAEILIDQQKLAQAEQLLQQALDRGQDEMDVHRINAYLLESQGAYNNAILEYDEAIKLTPNLTFLYLRAGANYRRLGSVANELQQEDLFIKSLEYFARAAKINAQLKVEDPTPYISISKTYSQMGDYFIAGRNIQKALDFKPADADIYGQLGIVFFKSRNYEGAIPALKCAVRGCTPPESCDARYGDNPCKPELDEVGVEVKGQALSASTVVYYFTYGSVMAALSRPQKNYCPEALKVFAEVRASFGADVDIMSIVEDGEAICRSVGQPNQVFTPSVPGGTLAPVLTATPVPWVR